MTKTKWLAPWSNLQQNDIFIVVNATNGSNIISASSGSFTSNMIHSQLIIGGLEYEILTVQSGGSSVTINSNFSGATGSYPDARVTFREYMPENDVYMSYNYIMYDVPEYKIGSTNLWNTPPLYQTKLTQSSTFKCSFAPDYTRDGFGIFINGVDRSVSHFDPNAQDSGNPRNITIFQTAPNGALYMKYLPLIYADRVESRTISSGHIMRLGARMHPAFIVQMREALNRIFTELELEQRLWIGGVNNELFGVPNNIVPGTTPILRDHILELSVAVDIARQEALTQGYTFTQPVTFYVETDIDPEHVLLAEHAETLRRSINILEASIV